jgi:hypothetical protein
MHIVSRAGEAIRTLTFFCCSVLLVIISVAAGGSGDAAQFHTDTFWGLSASSMSSTVALHAFFKPVIVLVRAVMGAVFEGSMSAICKK